MIICFITNLFLKMIQILISSALYFFRFKMTFPKYFKNLYNRIYTTPRNTLIYKKQQIIKAFSIEH